jgi:hypothetical protein
MTSYEMATIVISCFALVLSVWTFFAQRKTQKHSNTLQQESNDLQRATSELAKKQLEILLRDETGKHKAHLSLDLVREGQNNFRFYIRNVGEAEARDVELKLLVDAQRNPIVKSEYNEKFPIDRLQPGSSVSFIAALHLGSPTAYNATMSWTNPDGSRVEEEMYTAL